MSVMARLLEAQADAARLFEAIAAERLVRPGRSERQISEDVYALAEARFGVRTHWHKRVVRAGANTLCPYRDNPPDRVVGERDIVFLDLGPVFGRVEADFGRSFVLGDDPEMHRLVGDLAPLHAECKAFFHSHPGITGGDFFAEVKRACAARGWSYGGPYAGHLVGDFPHENPKSEHALNYIGDDNSKPMDAPDEDGNPRYWILEIHIVHPSGQFAAFLEEML